jgi:hypothetical protein
MNLPAIGRLRWPGRQSSAEEAATRAQERASREAQRQQATATRAHERTAAADRKWQEHTARQERRERAVARRRQVAGQLAAAALSWSWNARLEGAMWFCLAAGLAVDYIGSYADLAATFGAFGYNGWVAWIMPLGIDLPVTASVLGQLLAGRWKCGRWVRIQLGILTVVTAPLTLVGNALRGVIDANGHFVPSFHVTLWMDLAAFAVPGLGVVLIGWIASMMQGERAELTRRQLEAEAETTGAADLVTDETGGDNPPVAEGGEHVGEPAGERADGESEDVRNPRPHQPARVEVRRQLGRHRGAVTEDELRRLAGRVAERTGVSIPRARRLLREEQQLRLVTNDPQPNRMPAEVER